MPADGESLSAWRPVERRLVPTPPGGRVDVADSWLVDEGRVRGLALHAERFVASCRSRDGVPPEATRAFLEAAFAAMPRRGRWFPRVELEAGAGFRLRLRPAPDAAGGVVLWLAGAPDPRRDPTVKGPDLETLLELRRAAARHGADEAVLLSGTGIVLEGALSSLLWWRDGVLHAPAPELPLLPSVTRRLVLELAEERGIEVRFVACSVEDLDGAEVWSLGALHGIRPVTSWVAGARAGRARAAAAWQAELIALAAPLPQAP